MSLSAENEILIRKALAAKVGTVPEAGFVLPSPIYFQDRSDFSATLDPETTREALETKPIAAVWIYPVLPADEPDNRNAMGSAHSPLLNLTYEMYLFRGYRWTRADETDTPDPFDQKLLEQHSLFTKAWLDVRAEFLGKRAIDGLPSGVFSIARTTSLTFPAFIEDRAQCKYIPGLFGFAVRMHERVELLTEAC